MLRNYAMYLADRLDPFEGMFLFISPVLQRGGLCRYVLSEVAHPAPKHGAKT